MGVAITCPNPRCPNPRDVRSVVFSGTNRASPDSPRAKRQRRRANRRLMEPRTMFATWGIAGGLSGLLVVVGMYLLAFGPTVAGVHMRLIEAVSAWVAAAALMMWSRWANTHPRSTPQSNTQAGQLGEVYYCNGCGNVFEPTSGKYVPLDKANKLFV